MRWMPTGHGERIEDSLRRIIASTSRREVQHGARWLGYCAFVGIVAGAAALLFDLVSSVAIHGFLERFAGWSPARPAGETPLFHFVAGHRSLVLLVVAPTIGGLLSGTLVQWLAPEAAGHGTDAAIESFHHRDGFIRPVVPLTKIVASALTLGSGGSGGREGPIAQAGAGFGSYIATRLGLSASDRRVLMAAGMGAGIGSIFRAPLAGALFAAEILYSSAEFEASVLIPACVASIVAYCTFTMVHGTGTLFLTPVLSFTSPAELGAYFLLALVLVVFGYIYVRTFYGVHGWFERRKVHPALKTAAGGALTGLLGVALWVLTRTDTTLSVLSVGYGVIQQAFDAPATLATSAAVLLLVAIGKILTTSFTIGSGGSAGVFGPSMVIGGCVGGAVGLILHDLFPTVVHQPACYVVVGMAGFFSGVAKTPISTLVMVSEMTGSYSLLLPSMWVCVLTFAMSKRWHLYSNQVATQLDSPAHKARFTVDVLRGIRVREVVDTRRRVQVLHESDHLKEALAVVAASDQSIFPVFSASGMLVGVISLETMRPTLDHHFLPGVLVYDLMIPDCPFISPDSDLGAALRMFSAVSLDEIPVWDPEKRQLVGMLTQQRLTRAYVERLSQLEGIAPA